jgi:DNA mismatch repair protein MutL
MLSSRIQLLPAALADQIAAGEVVERPASVVKELIENALDAGAHRVDIEIERGGLSTIVVSDDGEGMSPADAHLALRRHATSKLRAAEDLFRLRSFGFRGEALPSIASISELTLTTRPTDADAGYVLVTRGGEVIEAGAAGAPRGTRVEVRALFAAVPARLKFQRAPGVEAAQVHDVVTRASLTAPGVHLRLRVDGRVALELPAHPSLAERARAISPRGSRGARFASLIHAEGPFLVEVHVAAPEAALHSTRRLHLLVNRRTVRDRGLFAAVQLGFGELIARGRYPIGVVSLSLPAAELDVNVHPQKLEVRMARAAEAQAAVRHAVARAVADGGFDAASTQRRAAAYGGPDDAAVALDELAFAAHDADDDRDPEARLDERGRVHALLVRLAAGQDGGPAAAPAAPAAPDYLGTLPGGYLVFAEDSGLALVDQHAASALVSLHEVDAELAATLADGGADEERELAVTMRAISPAVTLDADAACALYRGLRALAADGRVATLAEARWRGRRAHLRLPLSELLRRLDA